MKRRPSAADRLRPHAHVNKLAGLNYDDRKRVAADLSLVLREHFAYRLYFWLMLPVSCAMACAIGCLAVFIAKGYCR